MADVVLTGTRCPRCSAAVRPGAPWCTQCYAPAGAGEPAPPAPPRASVVPATPAPAAAVPAAAVPSAAGTAGSWPCTACGQSNDLALPACGGCGTPFLAAARDSPPTVVLPGVGDVLALSPVRRVGLAVGAVVGFLLVTALVAFLLS